MRQNPGTIGCWFVFVGFAFIVSQTFMFWVHVFFYLDLCRPGLNNWNKTIAQHLRFCQVSRPQINIVILIMVCINNKTLKQHIVQNLGFGDFWWCIRQNHCKHIAFPHVFLQEKPSLRQVLFNRTGVPERCSENKSLDSWKRPTQSMKYINSRGLIGYILGCFERLSLWSLLECSWL